MPLPPHNSPWLEGMLAELISAFPSPGIFPNSPLLLGSCLAASQQLFLTSPSRELYFLFANWPEVIWSQLDRVLHLLCRSWKRCSAEHHNINTTTPQHLPAPHSNPHQTLNKVSFFKLPTGSNPILSKSQKDLYEENKRSLPMQTPSDVAFPKTKSNKIASSEMV